MGLFGRVRGNFIVGTLSSIQASSGMGGGGARAGRTPRGQTGSAAVSHSLCAAKLAQPSTNGGRGEGRERVCESEQQRSEAVGRGGGSACRLTLERKESASAHSLAVNKPVHPSDQKTPQKQHTLSAR